MNPSFIEIYDRSLSTHQCQQLINIFEKSNDLTPGKVILNGNSIVNHDIKKSTELNGLKFSLRPDISDIIFPSLSKNIQSYNQKYKVLDDIERWKVDDDYTFKKFIDADDGYKVWHTEHGYGPLKSNRILVWMMYLNHAKSGTDFMYYPNVKSREGRCVIWPSGFTHFHRSSPNKGLKYIVSGWISFY